MTMSGRGWLCPVVDGYMWSCVAVSGRVWLHVVQCDNVQPTALGDSSIIPQSGGAVSALRDLGTALESRGRVVTEYVGRGVRGGAKFDATTGAWSVVARGVCGAWSRLFETT